MFIKIEEKLDVMIETLERTNKLLTKIEENLRVPDVVTWAKAIQEIRYDIRSRK